MTRKILLIAGVAGLALTAPASAEKGEKGGGDKPQQAEAAQGGEQKAQRQEASREVVMHCLHRLIGGFGTRVTWQDQPRWLGR